MNIEDVEHIINFLRDNEIETGHSKGVEPLEEMLKEYKKLTSNNYKNDEKCLNQDNIIVKVTRMIDSIIFPKGENYSGLMAVSIEDKKILEELLSRYKNALIAFEGQTKILNDANDLYIKEKNKNIKLTIKMNQNKK